MRNEKRAKAKADEPVRSIPRPEDILDPEKICTRADVFDFSEKGNNVDER